MLRRHNRLLVAFHVVTDALLHQMAEEYRKRVAAESERILGEAAQRASALGVTHAERNGHHYFRGLSAYSEAFQQAALEAHPGFYRRHERGFPTLEVHGGSLDLHSVNAAPFGCAIPIDAAQFTPLRTWIMSGGLSAL